MRWVLIFWMFVISAVAYLDRVNISIAGAFIEKEFGLDHVHLGWALSAFLIGYAISSWPVGFPHKSAASRTVLSSPG